MSKKTLGEDVPDKKETLVREISLSWAIEALALCIADDVQAFKEMHESWAIVMFALQTM